MKRIAIAAVVLLCGCFGPSEPDSGSCFVTDTIVVADTSELSQIINTGGGRPPGTPIDTARIPRATIQIRVTKPGSCK